MLRGGYIECPSKDLEGLVNHNGPSRPTFVLEVGKRISATFFRMPGSNFKHCRDEVLIARSNSSRFRSEFKKPSAPAHSQWSSGVPSDTVVILAVEQPSQIKIRSSLKYPSQLCSCDDAQDLKMEKLQMGTRLPWYKSLRNLASRGKVSKMRGMLRLTTDSGSPQDDAQA